MLLENIKVNTEVLEETVSIYRNNNVSYTDAYIAACSVVNGSGEVVSFYKGFDKVERVKRVAL